MPTVPTYGSPKVDERPIAGVKQTNTPGPEVFGAELGQTAAALGVHYATAAFDAERQQADEVALTDFSRQSDDWEHTNLHDPKTGVLNTVHGKDAYGLTEKISDAYDKFSGDLIATMNPRQQQAASRMATQRRAGMLRTLDGYAASEGDKYEKAVTSASLTNSQNLAIANAGDPDRVKFELGKQEAIIEGYAQHTGMPPEQRDELLGEARTKTHVGVISQLLASDHDQAAQAYFDAVSGNRHNYGQRADGSSKGDGFFGPLKRPDGKVSSEISIGVEIDGKEVEIPALVPTLTSDEVKTLLNNPVDAGKLPPAIVQKAVDYAKQRIADGKSPFAGPGEQQNTYPDLPRDTPRESQINGEALAHVQKALEEGSTRGASQRQSDAILSSTTSETDAINAAKAITDPKLRDAVEERVTHEWGLKKIAQRDATEQSMVAAGNIIDANPRKGVRAIDPASWVLFTPSQKATLEAYAKRNMAADGEGKTDYVKYYGLMRLAAENPEKFAASDLTATFGYLGKTERKQMIELQYSIRKGELKDANKTLDGFRTTEQIVNDTLDIAGVTRTGKDADKKQIANFRKTLDERVEALQQASGKKATKTDIQQTADDLMREVTLQKGSWLGILPGIPFRDVTKHAVDVTVADIPTADRTQIEQALRSAGRTVSDAAILNLYLAHQRRIGGQK